MEESTEIHQILESLKKRQCTKKLQQILLSLRKLVNVPNHKANIEHIKRNNCLKFLVSYTQYNLNPKVVDVSLSILGNCCTDASVVKISIDDFNILHNLSRVLEKHERDSIKGRVFRILGNLCDGYDPLRIILKAPDIIKNVIQFLKSFEIPTSDSSKDKDMNSKTTTVPTISMAMRFIKKLINRQSFDRLDVEFNIVNVFGILLIKCSNLWKDNKNEQAYRTLLDDVIKIFQVMSSPIFQYYNVVDKLTKTDEGNALLPLEEIIKIDSQKITKIILKLAPHLKNQSDLPASEIITKLINSVHLSRSNKPSRSHYVNLECVNKLMDHVGFRVKLRDSNNINNLIKHLKELDTEDDLAIQCSLTICSILLKCKYIRDLLKTQLDDDMVNIIIKKLGAVTGKTSKKICISDHKFKPIKSNTDKEAKRLKMTYDDDNLISNYININNTDRCASPSSCSDVSSCGPYSPAPSNTICYDSDSDNYSPLCSENEAEEDFKCITPDGESILSDCDQKRIVHNQNQLDLRNKFRDYMNLLLKFYFTLGYIDEKLGNPELLTLLINISFNGALLGENLDAAYSLIVMIVQTKQFIVELLSTDVILQLIEITDTKHKALSCSHCELLQNKAEDVIAEITMMVQTEIIKGDIAYNLFKKDNDAIKEKLVLTIPYVVRKQSILRELLYSCNGLDVLMNLLKNEENKEVQKQAIKSICTLAIYGIKIKNPVMKKDNSYTHSETLNGHYELGNKCDNVVTFKLDDGTLIQADRNELGKKSDYFSALLSGQFMESNQSEIVLGNVNRKSLYCLLELLKLNIKPNVKFIFNYELETILDLILLTDRFLLTDLNYILVCHVEQLITICNVPKFYKWSIESGTNILRIETVAYALVTEISYCERLDLFNSLFNLGYFTELVSDIEMLLKQFL